MIPATSSLNVVLSPVSPLVGSQQDYYIVLRDSIRTAATASGTVPTAAGHGPDFQRAAPSAGVASGLFTEQQVSSSADTTSSYMGIA